MANERYENKTYVGSGGMAIVYRAWDSVVGRDVALKEIAEELRQDPEVRDMFMREARKMAKVRHRNVVQVYDVLLENEAATLVQEYMDGGSLANRVGASTMSPDETLKMLQDVCCGLQAIHDAGLIHRDVKPDNILAHQGEWKVADFGVAMSGDEDVLPFVGSKYAAPEVLNAPDTISVRSDIYSVGVMATELILGSQQYEKSAREAMLIQLGEGAAPTRDSTATFWQRWVSSNVVMPLLCELNPVISREISEFIANLTARDPEQRPADCTKVIAEINALREAEAMRLGAPTARDPRVKARKAESGADGDEKNRKPLWFKLTMGVSVLLLTAVGALLLLPSKPKVYNIELLSTPADAAFSINGAAQKAVTPTTAEIKIGDILSFSKTGYQPVELTVAKGLSQLTSKTDGQLQIKAELERSFYLGDSASAMKFLSEKWAEVPHFRATIPTATLNNGSYTLPIDTPLHIAINPPMEGAITFIHLSSDNFATLVYPNPAGATLGVLADTYITVGDELDMAASEPLGQEWIVLVLTRKPLMPPKIEGSGLVEDWARYHEFGEMASPGEQLIMWLTEAAGTPLAVEIVTVNIVPKGDTAP
jgi:serine/threonine protein kinase